MPTGIPLADALWHARRAADVRRDALSDRLNARALGTVERAIAELRGFEDGVFTLLAGLYPVESRDTVQRARDLKAHAYSGTAYRGLRIAHTPDPDGVECLACGGDGCVQCSEDAREAARQAPDNF